MNDDGTRKCFFPRSNVAWPEGRQQVEDGEMAPGVVEVMTRAGDRIAVRAGSLQMVRDDGEHGSVLEFDAGDPLDISLLYDQALILFGWFYPKSDPAGE